MPLTDVQIRKTKPQPKPIRLYDQQGLYIEVSPAGSKLWRLKYRFGGKEKRLALGVYPEVGLRDARDKVMQARKLLADGMDPSAHRKAREAVAHAQSANSFEVVAREWYGKHAAGWAENHRNRLIRRLERDVFPWIGARPCNEITAPELLAVIRRIESRGALETAHRALANCGQVMRYAVATGCAERDPSGDLRGALPPVQRKHFASVLEPKRIGEILRAIDGYKGGLVVRCALRLAPLLFARPGELRRAKWEEINLEQGEWRYVASKTKTPHLVPLSEQAAAILRELHPLTGAGSYVFPSARSVRECMSDNALLSAMRKLGITKDEMTTHGWRACARTLLAETLGVRAELIEHQLAHAVRDPLGRAYNRTQHLPERRKMMQEWADHLDKLRQDV